MVSLQFDYAAPKWPKSVIARLMSENFRNKQVMGAV